jgi:molybdenum cofactor biosynthesis protein MoaC
MIREGKIPKGDPLPVAKVAAIQAAKNTSLIIPYCHPLPVDYVACSFELDERSIQITTEVKAIYKTGVEMEALTAASVAALTIYDMVKQVDEEMRIVEIRLVQKKGGKSDFQTTLNRRLQAGVLVISDSVSAGTRSDTSGKAIVDRLTERGVEVKEFRVVPDDVQQIAEALVRYSDEMKLDLVVTTGGTGLGPRDKTPEAMDRVVEREVPGIAEASRIYGQSRIPMSMLSRARAGLRQRTLIVNLPGSQRGVEESLDAILPGLFHAFLMIDGGGH